MLDRRLFLTPIAAVLAASVALSPALGQQPEEEGKQDKAAQEKQEARDQAMEAGMMDVSAGSGAIVFRPAEITLGEGLPSLPAGAKGAVLEGNPAEVGPLALRVWFPAGYTVAPHWHEALEHVTVLEGTLHIGMGEKLDKNAGIALEAGSFAAMPERQTHSAWTGDEPVLFQIHSNGPFEITYVNPEDDPRNAQAREEDGEG